MTPNIWGVKQKAESFTVPVSWHAGSSGVWRSVNASQLLRERNVSVVSQDCCFHLSHKSLFFILCQEPSPDLGKNPEGEAPKPSLLQVDPCLVYESFHQRMLYFLIPLDYATSNLSLLSADLPKHPAPPATSLPGPTPSFGLMSFHNLPRRRQMSFNLQR